MLKGSKNKQALSPQDRDVLWRDVAIMRTLTLEGVVTPIAIGANTNDYNPPMLDSAAILRVSASGAFNLTGLAGGRKGRTILLVNIAANTITIKDDDANSLAFNRIALSADFSLAADTGALLWYDWDSRRWRKI